MRCPFCKHGDTKVTDSRATDDKNSIRRRRECQNCGKRFTTYEMIEEVPLVVVKKNKGREVFDRSKILKGIMRACNKRAIPLSQMEEMAMQIERNLRNSLVQEVSSVHIGELVMAELRKVDPVAYIRFVSVYRDFKDMESFMAEINALKEKDTEE